MKIMSRDANGNYTLPTGNPVITGNTIDSSWANDTMSDLGNEITNSLDRFGKGGMAAPLRLINGSMTIPSMSFTSETNSGFYRAATGDIRLSIRNKDAMKVLEDAKLEVLQGVYTFNGAGLFQVTNKLYVGADATAPEVFTTNNVTTFAQGFLDDATASAARTTLGLGSAAVKNVDNLGDIGTGVITATADAVINGLTFGRGSGNVLSNTVTGRDAFLNNTSGGFNVAVGQVALKDNKTGSFNVAVGLSALNSNTSGNGNCAVGRDALRGNTTGLNGVALGLSALFNNTTGSGNTAITPVSATGVYAPVFNPTTENNRMCIGSTAVTNAYIQVAWTVVSDERDKAEFAPVPHGLEFVNQLNPTAFKYKADREDTEGHGAVRYGFKAQDVLALEGENPVICDNEDEARLRLVETSLIPVLVNAIKELTARVEALEQGI
jgi:hypothetical protein